MKCRMLTTKQEKTKKCEDDWHSLLPIFANSSNHNNNINNDIMEENYEYVFYLSNLSISCFQEGHLDVAVKCLMTAFHELPLLEPFFLQPSSPKPDNPTQPLDQAAPAQPTNSRSPVCADWMYWVKIEIPTNTRGDWNPREASMYAYALNLSTDHQDWTAGLSPYATKAALLYNLAYIHHWRARHLGISSALPVALQLYVQAAEAAQQLGARTGVDQLTLAIWNNMGHTHYQLLELNYARQCFNTLRLFMADRIDSIAVLHTIEDYATFVLSAMLPVPELRIAPAA